MANGGGGRRAPAPRRGPPCPPDQNGIVSSMVVLLRQMDARAKASAVERARHFTEIEFLKHEQSRRLEIAQDSIQEIRRDAALAMSFKEELAELLGRKELEASEPNFDDLGDNYLECFRSWISTLAAENSELKKKLKEFQSRAEVTVNIVDQQQSARDSNAEVRKLKQAYKTMVAEKEKELSALRSENSFAWHQLGTMENENRKQATEAAEKLKQTVHEFQLVAKEKNDEIGRLRMEVVSAKENMSIIQNELEQMRSLVKSKDIETDQLETSHKLKKDVNETNRKSKVEGPVLREKPRISQATPVRREVKTTRKNVSNAKVTQSQSGKSSRMHNTEGRGQSETSQKRKRGSHSLSHGVRRCSTRLQVRPAASPTLFTPCFTIPKLTALTPPSSVKGQMC